MAELLECLFCGYKTVRCGMTNHLKSKHRDVWILPMQDLRRMTKSLGQVKNWSKNRNQEPKRKA